jgi:proline dehydrogenase
VKYPPRDLCEKEPNLIHSGTYQSYLTRQPALLLTAIRHAEKNGYALGVKLVRGAYFVQERQKWKEEGREGPDPIWPDKQSTDMAFNTSVSMLVSTLADQLKGPRPELALTVFFGTHNEDSVSRIIGEMKTHGLASEGKEGRLRVRDDAFGKIFIAQLYGGSSADLLFRKPCNGTGC